jgi:hypothetical protein
MLSEQHGVYNVNVRCFTYPVHQGLFYQLMHRAERAANVGHNDCD